MKSVIKTTRENDDDTTSYVFECGCRVTVPNCMASEETANEKHFQLSWNGCKATDEDICFGCEHGLEHHQHADACRFENCQCKCYE